MIDFIKSLFGVVSIKREVMKVVSKRIDEVQKTCNVEVCQLNTKLREDLRALKVNHEVSKSQVISKHINSVLSKIL